MYNKIQIISTDEKGKYLFINDNNLIYGGFIVKDIVELLQEKILPEKIASILSQKYHTEIKTETVNEITNNQLNRLLYNTAKKRSVRKFFNINLNPNAHYPKFILYFFNTVLFYSLLCITFILNTLFYLRNDQNYNLSHSEQIQAYFLLFVVLILHEFGHIISAKFFNTNVKEIGIGMYRIIPVLYVNLNEIWKLNKKKRIIINLSGVYFQSLLGSLIILFFIITQYKILGYLFKINYIVLIFNLNPFFQFDGYWVVTDLIKEKNLNHSSNSYLRNILKKNQTPKIIKVYSFLRLSFFIYILFLFVNKIITYVS